MVLILIKQNILKTQNEDFTPSKIVTTKLSGIDFNRAKYFKNAKSRFPPSKIEYVIALLK